MELLLGGGLILFNDAGFEKPFILRPTCGELGGY
jgi:hypothetical protein